MSTYFTAYELIAVGSETDYVTIYNENISVADTHDHVVSGKVLTQDSVEWDYFDLNITPIYYNYSVELEDSSSVISVNNSIYSYDNELTFLDGSGNNVIITNAGNLNITGDYNGFYGNMAIYGASASYSSTNNKYTYSAQSNVSIVFDAATVYEDSSITTPTFSSIYCDSQTAMYTDGGFPGDTSSLDTSNLTFFIDDNGYLQANDISSGGSGGTNSYLISSTQANSIDYLYGSGVCNTNLTNMSFTNHYDPLIINVQVGTLRWRNTCLYATSGLTHPQFVQNSMQMYDLLIKSTSSLPSLPVYYAKFFISPTSSHDNYIPTNLLIDNGFFISWYTQAYTGTGLHPFTFGHSYQIVFFNGYDTSNLVAVPSTSLVLCSDDRTLPTRGIFIFRVQDRSTGEFVPPSILNTYNMTVLLSFWFAGDYEQY